MKFFVEPPNTYIYWGKMKNCFLTTIFTTFIGGANLAPPGTSELELFPVLGGLNDHELMQFLLESRDSSQETQVKRFKSRDIICNDYELM